MHSKSPRRASGGDSAKRENQVTRNALEKSGTLRWSEDLGGDARLSSYGYRGGYVMLEEERRYTAVRMAPEEADAARGTPEGKFSLVVHLQTRIDDNVEASRERRKAIGGVDGDGVYVDPVDALESTGPDPAERAIAMAAVEQVLRKAFRLMTAKQRHVWTKCVLEDWTYIELAREIGVSRQAVRDCFMKAQRIVDEVAEELELR